MTNVTNNSNNTVATETVETIKVSAPASTMIMGEHAVLFGHKAIVCALDQRIFVSLRPRTDNKVCIHSSLRGLETKLEDILQDQLVISELSFVLACIQLVAPKQGFELTIESEFSHTVGLGSSAAVTAACVYALLIYKQSSAKNVCFDEVFDIGLQVIHKVQKQGSGSDLVASVYGGMQSYTKEPRQIQSLLPLIQSASTTAEDLSKLPILSLYYAGYKTPTPQVLAQVAKQAEKFPQLYQGLYQQMQSVSLVAETAIGQRDWHALGKLMNIYHGLMDALGVCDGKMAELIYSARAQDNVLGAKISGSGLGDCIITLATNGSADNDLADSKLVGNDLISNHLKNSSPQQSATNSNDDTKSIELCGVAPIQVEISERGLVLH